MDNEVKLNLLTSFAKNRQYILNTLALADEIEYIKPPPHKEKVAVAEQQYPHLLLEKPVSKLSKFSDSIWDFNADYPNAARNIQGAKLRIDFSKFNNIPKFVEIEIKTIFELALINNYIFKPQIKVKKTRVKGVIKANSLIPIFESGLTFINEIFKQATNDFGKDFVHNTLTSLSDITPNLYTKAAINYPRIKGIELDKFFKYLHSPAALDYVFQKPLAFVELNSLTWNRLSNAKKDKKLQVLPDNVFETLSRLASFIIVDFLSAIGDTGKISDTSTLDRFKVSNHESWAKKQQITHEILNGYIALRLRTKNYSSDFVKHNVQAYEWMLNDENDIPSGQVLRKLLKNRIYDLDGLRQYLNLVAYASIYLVGQYTGMRPSELAEVIVQECACLVEEDNIWLIESTVKKHAQETCTGLFDDRWVAIPIVKDAILAASYIAKIKASPYLLSNVDTVNSNATANSMSSSGIKHQMHNFISQLMGQEIAREINFNAYMLRHTLTYQLFRADVGLPLISFQLKHFVDSVSKYTARGATSSVTLGYGEVGEILSKDGNRKGNNTSLRRSAELDVIKAVYNPNAIYYGGKANEHKERLMKVFQGYMAYGFTEDKIYEAMVEQGFAVVNVGQGLCYGGKMEDYDSSLPCIGSLRCNPARCKQAVVTRSHAPKWREVYILNKANLNNPEYAYNREQIIAAMEEAKMVLENLGEVVEL